MPDEQGFLEFLELNPTDLAGNPNTWNTGVYQITNHYNRKKYIGGAYVDMVERWKQHYRDLMGGYHRNCHLQRAWKKHAHEFEFEVVEYCPPEQVLVCEQKWLDDLWSKGKDARYNINPIAESRLGAKWNDESRARARASHIGIPLSESHKAGLRSAAAIPEFKARRAAAAANRPPISEETRAKLRARPRRKPTSEELERRSQSAKAREATPEGQIARQKNITSLIGRVMSEETRKKISASKQGQRRGENGTNSKLKEFQVREIFSLCHQGVKQVRIAEQYDISVATVQAIKSRRIWKHLDLQTEET